MFSFDHGVMDNAKSRLVGKLCARIEISRYKRFSKALLFQVETELQGSTAAEHPMIDLFSSHSRCVSNYLICGVLTHIVCRIEISIPVHNTLHDMDTHSIVRGICFP